MKFCEFPKLDFFHFCQNIVIFRPNFSFQAAQVCGKRHRHKFVFFSLWHHNVLKHQATQKVKIWKWKWKKSIWEKVDWKKWKYMVNVSVDAPEWKIWKLSWDTRFLCPQMESIFPKRLFSSQSNLPRFHLMWWICQNKQIKYLWFNWTFCSDKKYLRFQQIPLHTIYQKGHKFKN